MENVRHLEDSAMGFAVDIPSDWELIAPRSERGEVLRAIASPDTQAVVIKRHRAAATLDAAVEHMCRQLEAHGFIITDPAPPATPATSSRIRYRHGDRPTRVSELQVFQRGAALILAGVGSSRWSDDGEQLRGVLDSFTLL